MGSHEDNSGTTESAGLQAVSGLKGKPGKKVGGGELQRTASRGAWELREGRDSYHHHNAEPSWAESAENSGLSRL